jgi:acyl dehydratase
VTDLSLHVGFELPTFRVTVEPAYLNVFSLLVADPNPLHFDAAAVARAGLGDKPLSQGTLNIAYALNVVLAVVDAARITKFTCRFLGRVYAHDEVVAGGIVTEATSDEATIALWMDNGDGERVLTGTAIVEPASRPVLSRTAQGPATEAETSPHDPLRRE